MKLRTDDAVYRVRMVFLGPPGYTLWWHWPYRKYLLYIAVIGPVLLATWLATGSTLAMSYTGAAAVAVAEIIWRRVDADQPIRLFLWTIIRDLHRDTPRTEQRLPAFTSRHITITEQPEGAGRGRR